MLAYGLDADGRPLHAVWLTAPAHALSHTLNPDASFVYMSDPAHGFGDSWAYEAVNDLGQASTPATVYVVVYPFLARPDFYTVPPPWNSGWATEVSGT